MGSLFIQIQKKKMAPKVSAITLYPIKSCHYINVDSCEVDELGLKLDRRFMFVDESTGRFITQRSLQQPKGLFCCESARTDRRIFMQQEICLYDADTPCC